MISMGFPLVYRQSEGLLDELGEQVASFGTRPLVVVDAFIQDQFGERIASSLQSAGLAPVFYRFSGECSPRAIDDIVQAAKAGGCDMTIGLGGGKALDASKAVKLDCGLPVVLVPTIASNDAPTSRLIITYTDEGEFLGPRLLSFNPDAVLVDTQIIAQAPVRFLVAGIGDALATHFEAEQCARSGAVNFFNGQPTEAALTISKRCYELLREYGVEAVISAKEQTVSTALSKIVEANVLLSGLGFEGCGVAGAHGVSQGFSLIPSMHGALHGEEVAVGLIIQLIMEGRSDDYILELLTFYNAIGLPASVDDLAKEPLTGAQLETAAKFAAREGGRAHNMVSPVTPVIVLQAMAKARKLVEASRMSAA